MAKTCGGNSYRPRVQPSSSPPAPATAPALAPLVAAPTSADAPAAEQGTPSAVAAVASHAPVPAAPTPYMYDTRVALTPPSPTHPTAISKGPTSKEGLDSGSGESSN